MDRSGDTTAGEDAEAGAISCPDDGDPAQQGSDPREKCVIYARVADLSDTDGLLDRGGSLSMIGAEDDIVEALDEENLSLVWIVQGEKRVRTKDFGGNEMGKTQTRGIYSLNDEGKIVGEQESDYYEFD